MQDEETGPCVRARCWPPRALAAAALTIVVMLAGRAEAGSDGAMPAAFRRPLLKADRILVLKSARKLELLKDGVVLKTFPIALGEHPFGTKHFAGDGRTPEGIYTIDGRLVQSHYHLALHVSYPNPADRAVASAAGRDPGGNIMIHGLPNWYDGPLDPARFYKDWTDGCISVGDRAIEEISAAITVGTVVEIRP